MNEYKCVSNDIFSICQNSRKTCIIIGRGSRCPERTGPCSTTDCGIVWTSGPSTLSGKSPNISVLSRTAKCKEQRDGTRTRQFIKGN